VIRNLLEKLRPYSPIRVSDTFWEKRYSDGAWDRLRAVEELGRYSLIAGYARFFSEGGSVLDVGCGEGILYEKLCQGDCSRYLGIDISTVAIAKARVRDAERHRFLAARIEDFGTDEKFDVIIFNECLYYMEDPVGTLRHYEGFLAENGVFIVSMHSTAKSMKIWKRVDGQYRIRDAVSVTNLKGVCWVIKALEGKAQDPGSPCLPS